MQKRILIFSLAYQPLVGGAEIAIKEITDRMPAQFDFHMITLRFSKEHPRYEHIGNINVHRVGFGPSYISKIFFVPLAVYMALFLHRRHPFVGMWAMMSYMLFPIVLLRACTIRLPYILTLQEGDSFERMFGRIHIFPLKPFLQWGFRHASVIQAISTYLGAWARVMGYRGVVEIIPNGVAIRKFAHPTRLDSVPIKKEKEKFLITTSRLVPKNAVDIIIKSLSLLPDTISLLILGDGPERQKLEQLAKEKRVSDRVRFLGFIPYDDLPAYLQSADIFIRPSRSEGMGNSFIEAMAAGIPVIATQVGGIADFLFDRSRNPSHPPTGFAVDVDSPEQIAQAVRKILEDTEETRAVVKNAQQLVAQKYEWDIIARDMNERVFKFL